MLGSGFANIPRIPELKRRLFFTLFILAVYRLGVHVPTPGVDVENLSNWLTSQKGTIFTMFNMFTGGALSKFSIFALGIMPYISSSIILQLLTVVVPHLEALSKEGDAGRKKITQYTRYGTVVISLIQGYMISIGLENMNTATQVVIEPGWGFRLMSMVTLTAGTAFIMWLGEQITERGIGNGISLIIFAGIVAGFPSSVISTYSQIAEGSLELIQAFIMLAVIVVTILFIIFMERGHRKIPVQYAKRIIGRRQYGGQSSYLPLKINMAGVIPPIFASSLMMFPATIMTWLPANSYSQSFQYFFSPGGWIYNSMYVGAIVFFAYFYTAIQYNPNDVSENLKRQGGYIPGIRPGATTAQFIETVVTRLTAVGSVYLAIVCVLPTFMYQKWNVSFYFGGTTLLIVIGVALDFVQQLEFHLISRHYDGFLKKGRIKGRRSF